jgi:hypothetical protein
MKTLFDSLVRTFTPIIVGAVLGWFVAAGIPLDPEFETALTLVIGAVFTVIYYLAVRLFETYVSPKFGWMLGLAKEPVYVTPAEKSQAQEIVSNAINVQGESHLLDEFMPVIAKVAAAPKTRAEARTLGAHNVEG